MRLDIRHTLTNNKVLIICSILVCALFASVVKDFDIVLFNSKLSWPVNDKVTHFMGAGVFGFLAVMFTKSTYKFLGIKINRVLLFLLCFSIIEESTQILRPNRGFSFYDMAANVLGILVFSKLGELALKRGIILR